MPEITSKPVKEFGDQRALDDVSFTVETASSSRSSARAGAGSRRRSCRSPASSIPRRDASLSATRCSSTPRSVAVPAEQRNLGIVFQSYAVWPHMTVFENLASPSRCGG